jgi:uncharacterized membrane protein
MLQGRNLYILAGALGFFAVVCFVLAFTGIAHEPGAPTDSSLWRTMGAFLLVISLIAGLMAVMQTMFEQAERRDTEHRQAERERRRKS